MTADQTLPVLVLMPGLDGTGKLFAEFVKQLNLSVECAVMAYPADQPMGYGELKGLVVSALPSDRPFVLLGESFSGPLAIRIAAEAPAGLVGLILCVTFAKNPYPGLGWARSLASYLPLKGLPRWVRAPLMWGSVSPSSAPSQIERAMSCVSAPVIRWRATEVILEHLPQARVVEVDGPHLLLQTRAAECAQVVVGFLRALEPAAS